MKDKKSIFLGTTEICHIMLKLHRELDKEGIRNGLYIFYDFPYSKDEKLETHQKELDAYHWIYEKCYKYIDKNVIWKARILQVVEMSILLWFYIKMLLRYNTFIFMYGHGIFKSSRYLKKVEELEFIIYKMLRKKVIMIYVGTDARPPCNSPKFEGNVHDLYDETLRISNRVRMIEKYCTVISAISTSAFLNHPFIIYNAVFPIIDNADISKKSKEEHDKIVILHAPSHYIAKGTSEIRRTIERLKQRGCQIDYIEMNGFSHKEVIDTLRMSDVVIDQINASEPTSTLSSEACANGVPVIICGNYQEYYELVPEYTIAPICYWENDRLEDNLYELINDKDRRIEIGRKEEEFILSRHTPKDVVKRLLAIIDGNVDEEWCFCPKKDAHLPGTGITEDEIGKRVVALVDTYGAKALRIRKDHALYKEYQRVYNKYKNKYANYDWSSVVFYEK